MPDQAITFLDSQASTKDLTHVNVSVKYVVLRVLVSTVNAFFSEHYCDIRTCNAGDVGMVVDWTTNFIFDEVDSLSLCSDLLTSNRNTTDTLRSTFP